MRDLGPGARRGAESAGASAAGDASPSSRDAAKARRREARARRAERYDSLFPAWSLALSGAVCSVAYLFQPHMALKAALFVLVLAAALSSGKKVSLLATVLVSAGIVAANLLVPVGRVIWQLGAFRVTETALLEGLDKALTFEGLIYISKASIRPGLRLPGRFGFIVSRAFVYYDRIVEYKGRIRAAYLFEDIDALMLATWEAAVPTDATAGGKKPKAALGNALAFGAATLSLAILAAGSLLLR